MAQIIGAGIQIFDGSGGGAPSGTPVVAAANGLSLETRMGLNTVVLGGTIDEDTELLINSDLAFGIGSIDGLAFWEMQAGNTVGWGASSQNGAYTFIDQIDAEPNPNFLEVQIFTTRNSDSFIKGFFWEDGTDSDVPGINVQDDIDEIGLIGAELFPIAAVNPAFQYVQRGLLGAGFIAQNNFFDAVGLNGDNNILSFLAAAGAESIFSLSSVLITNTFSSGCVLHLTYDDMDGNTQNITLATGLSVGSVTGLPTVFRVLPNSTVSIDVTSPGLDIYTVNGTLLLIGQS